MPIQEDLQAFLAEWHDPSPFLEVQTSGSTGTPKRMRVRKDRMLNSARLTCDYLGLKKGDKALLCMPLRYIAGKMMVVRSLYAGLDLEVREPSGHPLADWGDTPLRFAAMIPLQVYNTLRVPEERKRLEQTDILIIGGGAIDDDGGVLRLRLDRGDDARVVIEPHELGVGRVVLVLGPGDEDVDVGLRLGLGRVERDLRAELAKVPFHRHAHLAADEVDAAFGGHQLLLREGGRGGHEAERCGQRKTGEKANRHERP